MTDDLNENLIPKLSRTTDSLSSGFDSDDADSFSSGENEKSMTLKEIAVASATALLVTTGVAASVAAMVSVSSFAVYVAGGICILNAPTLAHRTHQLSKGKGVRRSMNNLRTEINILGMENNFLSQSVNTLQSELGTLQMLEDELSCIAKKQGRNVEELIALVTENESVLRKMKFNLRQSIVSDVAKIFITADRNRDLKIDLKDIPIITLKVQIQLEAKGINLDAESFGDMIREDNSVTAALKFCGDILFQDEEEDSDDDSEMSIDFDVSDFDVSGQFKGNQSRTMTEKRMSMFSIKDKYSKGSVEVARGKRSTIAPKTETRRKTMTKQIRKSAALQRRAGNMNLIIEEDSEED